MGFCNITCGIKTAYFNTHSNSLKKKLETNEKFWFKSGLWNKQSSTIGNY